jgi:hypothetical protein
MRKEASGFLVCTLVTLCLMLPATASTWRSTAGNVFRFYPDGSMTTYGNGKEHVGYWWWISSNHKFGYSVAGHTAYVTVTGAGALCKGTGPSQQWTLMSVRGEPDQDEDNLVDTRSWFMSRTDTPTIKTRE